MNKLKAIFFLIFFSFSSSFAQSSNDIVKSIFFGGGSYGIDDVQAQDLADLVKSIKNLEYYEINIMSHTDNIGSKEFNQYLSQMRSKEVIDLLRSFDIPQEKIKFKDFGLEKPAFDNNTWEGRMNNRRVDIQFKPIVF
jgi:outer membrane protein OmpA-like peptidoglycan-associated protein